MADGTTRGARRRLAAVLVQRPRGGVATVFRVLAGRESFVEEVYHSLVFRHSFTEAVEGEVNMEVNMEVSVEAEKTGDWEAENEAKEKHVETKKEEVNRRHYYLFLRTMLSVATITAQPSANFLVSLNSFSPLAEKKYWRPK